MTFCQVDYLLFIFTPKNQKNKIDKLEKEIKSTKKILSSPKQFNLENMLRCQFCSDKTTLVAIAFAIHFRSTLASVIMRDCNLALPLLTYFYEYIEN